MLFIILGIVSCKKDKVQPVGTIGKIVVYQGVSYKWDYCSSTNNCNTPDTDCHCFYYDPLGYWYQRDDRTCERAGAGTKPH